MIQRILHRNTLEHFNGYLNASEPVFEVAVNALIYNLAVHKHRTSDLLSLNVTLVGVAISVGMVRHFSFL